MKKLLILAYDFPPYNSIGGQRPWSWYLHFAEQGWQPVVVTRHWDRPINSPLDVLLPSLETKTTTEQTELGTIIRVPNKVGFRYRIFIKFTNGKLSFIRKGISFFAYALSFFSVRFDNKSGLYHAARKYLRENQVDAIVATGDPFVLFYYASLLSKEFGTPWVADYRDCWSNRTEITLEPLILLEKFVFKIFRFIEKRTVRSAALITCPCVTFKSKLLELFPQKNIQLVYNGYFGDFSSAINGSSQGTVLTISHGGTVYPFQPFEVFAAGLEQLLDSADIAPPLKVNWYGTAFFPEQVQRITLNHRVAQFFNITGRLPREALIEEFKRSDILLLFASSGIVAAKVFDYILAGRPIVLIGDKGGEMEELVLKYQLGYVCRNAGEVCELLSELLTRKKRGDFPAFTPREDLEFFSRRHQAGIMCKLLDELVADAPQKNNLLSSDIKPMTAKSTPPRPYQQCSRCVMDTGDPDIRFDHKGVCNHCTDFLQNRAIYSYQGTPSDAALEKLLKDIKAAGRGRKYDCVLGLSGGVDSSYAAYLARQLGLRVLAVHLDNGWNSPIAVSNFKAIADRLRIDLECHSPDANEFRDLQVAFLKASVPEAETPTDIAIPAILHRVAASHGVKYIISGGNYATEGIMPVLWHYNARDTRYLKHIHKRFGTERIRSFPLFGFMHEMYFKLVKGIKTIYLLNYVPYNKSEASALLQAELGWSTYGGKHFESHYTAFIQGYYLFRKFGIDYRRAMYSTQICLGQMSRDEALKQLEQLPYNEEKVKKDKVLVAEKLGLKPEELDQITAAPPKWYRDYPNQEKFLGIVYDTYRKLYRKKKGYNF